MNVGQLIEILKDFDAEMPVTVNKGDNVFKDDFIEINEDLLGVVESRTLTSIRGSSTQVYDCSLSADKDGKILTLNGMPEYVKQKVGKK